MNNAGKRACTEDAIRVLRAACAERAARAPEPRARTVHQRRAPLAAWRASHPRRGSHTGPSYLFPLLSPHIFFISLYKLLHLRLASLFALLLVADYCRASKRSSNCRCVPTSQRTTANSSSSSNSCILVSFVRFY